VAYIALASKNLLSTYEKFSLFVGKGFDASADSDGAIFLALDKMLQSLRLLERGFNPEKLSWDNVERSTFGIAYWPTDASLAILRIKTLVNRLIKRWDVPEICAETEAIYGTGAIGERKINRPVPARSVTEEEKAELVWCVPILEMAVRDALSVSPPEQRDAELTLPPGLRELAELKTNGPIRPRWIPIGPRNYRLLFGEIECLCYKKKAESQFKILQAFEEAGWPIDGIDAPLSGNALKDALRDIRKRLLDSKAPITIEGSVRLLWRPT
jgi:hypothetical protein